MRVKMISPNTVDFKKLSKEHNVARYLEKVGRISHGSQIKDLDTTKRFIQMLMKLGHLSIFEHFSISFEIADISRACATQLLRHRHCAFTQESMRYVKLDPPDFVIPDSIENLEHERLKEVYYKTLDTIADVYNILIKNGVRKEDARFILPLSTTTKLVMTTNIREWLHVINVRVTKHAQWEVRSVVSEIWKQLYELEPFIFSLESILLLHDVIDIETKTTVFEQFDKGDKQ